VTTWIFILAAFAALTLVGGFEVLARVAHTSFLKSVILGRDGRTSTSKTFILLWTLLVSWALISLLIAGTLWRIHSCAAIADLRSATKACASKDDQVGLLEVGWRNFLRNGLAGSYLVLLGIPAVAGVAAQGITQAKAASGTVAKARLPSNARAGTGLSARLAQIFSADDQTTDVGDFQYVVFNLLTAAYFFTQFINPDGSGLPSLPDTLLGLTGVSAALYVGKKAADRSSPSVTGVFPTLLREGQPFTVTGTSLTADPAQADVQDARITINGHEAIDVRVDQAASDRLTAIVPPGLAPAGPVPGTLQVESEYGAITPGFDIQCA
jgi:hypothetical protein